MHNRRAVCSWHSLQVAAVVPECAMLEIQFDERPLFMRLTGDAHPLVDSQGARPDPAASAISSGL
jgi:hypothetical protein